MYALDTNTVLDYFKGKGEVAKNLLAVPPGEVALPAIVAYEVWIGVLGSVYPLTRVGPPPSGFVNSRSAPIAPALRIQVPFRYASHFRHCN